jgi:hypothetical protein
MNILAFEDECIFSLKCGGLSIIYFLLHQEIIDKKILPMVLPGVRMTAGRLKSPLIR